MMWSLLTPQLCVSQGTLPYTHTPGTLQVSSPPRLRDKAHSPTQVPNSQAWSAVGSVKGLELWGMVGRQELLGDLFGSLGISTALAGAGLVFSSVLPLNGVDALAEKRTYPWQKGGQVCGPVFLYAQNCTCPCSWSMHSWEPAGPRLCSICLGTALTSPEMHMAPADWPKRVTQLGSPPKASMFLCTQRRAATWSSSAQFPRA